MMKWLFLLMSGLIWSIASSLDFGVVAAGERQIDVNVRKSRIAVLDVLAIGVAENTMK